MVFGEIYVMHIHTHTYLEMRRRAQPGTKTGWGSIFISVFELNRVQAQSENFTYFQIKKMKKSKSYLTNEDIV